MYPKNKTNEIILEYSERFKQALGIKSFLSFHVENSKSIRSKKRFKDVQDCVGVSFINIKNSADVVLFYDKIKNRNDAVSTLFHELLHVRLNGLTGLITANQNAGEQAEEKLVLDLEKLFMSLFINGELC